LDGYGSFLGRDKGCLLVRDQKGKEKRFPLVENEIGEVQIKSGNSVSAGALATLGFWGIDCLVLTQRGNPVAVLKSLSDDMHVETRISQYEALKSEKGIGIAKTLVLAKIEGQNQVLKRYGLRRLDFAYVEQIKSIQENDLTKLRRKITQIEAKCAKQYFHEVFSLFPEMVRPERRKTFKAYDGVNNLFNLGYEMLRWKVHVALLKAELEPYLGFLHSLQFGKPSLVCDFQELYRYLMDDFIIQHFLTLRKSDLVLKEEDCSPNRKGKREYLKKQKNNDFIKKLNKHFTDIVEVPRMRVGERQEIETLINEEAFLFAKYLRGEKTHWEPRIAELR
jgi:CRISPR-associated protein Cas1